MRDKTVNLSDQAEELTSAFVEFRAKAKQLSEEQDLVRKALDKSNPIWELLTLPSVILHLLFFFLCNFKTF